MAAVEIPNPSETPDPWDTLAFREGKTSYVWPPADADGIVEWSDFEDKVDLDKKKKSGSAKPRTSKTGGDAVKFSFTMKWSADDATANTSVATVLDKLRPGAGPFYLDRHPWALLLKIKGFMVESVRLAPPGDGILRVTISCIELDPDAQAGAGKNVSKTPSRRTAEQQALDEWRAGYELALAYTNTQRFNEYAKLQGRSKETGIPLAGRGPKKLQSLLPNDGDIGPTPNTAKKPDPPADNVATGSTGL